MIAPALAAAALGCAPLRNASQLWSEPRTIFVGETHGTNETPKAFTDLVCSALEAGKPLSVGLELDSVFQPDLDSYLDSDGSLSDRERFVQSVWKSRFKDGRSSEAYFRLIETLRTLRQRAPLPRVFAFVEPGGPESDNINETGNFGIAARISREKFEFPDRTNSSSWGQCMRPGAGSRLLESHSYLLRRGPISKPPSASWSSVKEGAHGIVLPTAECKPSRTQSQRRLAASTFMQPRLRA